MSRFKLRLKNLKKKLQTLWCFLKSFKCYEKNNDVFIIVENKKENHCCCANGRAKFKKISAQYAPNSSHFFPHISFLVRHTCSLIQSSFGESGRGGENYLIKYGRNIMELCETHLKDIHIFAEK